LRNRLRMSNAKHDGDSCGPSQWSSDVTRKTATSGLPQRALA
jgi:hypothetical protein